MLRSDLMFYNSQLSNIDHKKGLDKLVSVSVSRTKGFDGVFVCTCAKECLVQMGAQYVEIICAL